MRVFVTGASGHIGSAVVADLLAAGHEVVGLARSDTSAAAVAALGATVRRGDLDDLDGLREAAAESEGIIHAAFKHDLMSTDFAAAVRTELAVVHALGDVLTGTGKPLVTASGMGVPEGLGRPFTEEDAAPPSTPEEAGTPRARADSENAVVGFAERGVRSAVVRIPPITHSSRDRHGLTPMLVAIARQKGFAGYPGDGANRWPAVHTLDVARLFRLVLEKAPAGTRWHAVEGEGTPLREIAQGIGDGLGLPVKSVPLDDVRSHFGPFLATVIARDLPASTRTTRSVLGWEPTGPGLLDEFAAGTYFTEGD
ncbi:SDR family oxidoreductase [Streptomyces griseorubiginosus]|uniref:SDR family oxidoreductase n=1 Tax=Streptomyces griseorubiginosus TaxID=67304 RepID=UPI001AD62813|nr:SDR family oxidoreductase [Streptomyces griseorubiginosus]MBO4252802.1 NAD-dependent epimerase/dehydratase family protein [Streptomyces griseorubiginosus]